MHSFLPTCHGAMLLPPQPTSNPFIGYHFPYNNFPYIYQDVSVGTFLPQFYFLITSERSFFWMYSKFLAIRPGPTEMIGQFICIVCSLISNSESPCRRSEKECNFRASAYKQRQNACFTSL